MNQTAIDELHRIVAKGDAGKRPMRGNMPDRAVLQERGLISLGFVGNHRRWTATALGIEEAKRLPSTAQLVEHAGKMRKALERIRMCPNLEEIMEIAREALDDHQ